MPKVGEAWYELSAKDAELLASLNRSEGKIKQAGTTAEHAFTGNAKKGADEFGNAVEGAGKKSSGFGSAVSQMSTGVLMGVGQAAFMGITSAVGGLTSAVIGGASDWNENISKSGVVFGQFAGTITDFARTAPQQLGITQSAALGAASTLGNLFVSLKLGQEPAAEMSKGLVQLASDLASFNNVDPAEALDALRSGLVGETEPLRRFGVNMNDATLTAKALELGLISSVKEGLTPAAKAQAAYALILDQTKTAQGDFARTSDGFANQQRIANAVLADGLARLGQKILPVLVAIMPKLIDGVTFFFDAIDTGAKIGETFVNDFLMPAIKFGQDLISLFLGPALPATEALGAAFVVFAGATVVGAVTTGMSSIILKGTELIASFKAIATQATESAAVARLAWAGAIAAPLVVLPAAQDAFNALGDALHGVFGPNSTVFFSNLDAVAAAAKAAAPPVREVATGFVDMAAQGAANNAMLAGLTKHVTETIPKVQTFGNAFAQGREHVSHFAQDAEEMLNHIPEAAGEAGRKTDREFAAGIRERREEPLDAFNDLVELLKHPMTVTHETARLIGQLTGEKLAEGLTSKDPVIRNAANGVRNTIIDRLEELEPHTGTITSKAMAEIVAGMSSADPKIRAASFAIYNAAKTGPDKLTENAKGWAERAGAAYASGLYASANNIAVAASAAVRGARQIFAAASPPGPESPLHEIDKWGFRTGQTYADNLARGLRQTGGVSEALGGAASILNPVSPASVSSAMAGAPGGASFTGPLIAIENFTGDQASVDRLMDALTDRLRQLIPTRSLGVDAA